MADEVIIIPEEAKLLDILLHERKMARYPEQEDNAIDLLAELVNELQDLKEAPRESSIVSFLTRRIAELDELLTAQVNEILHDPSFQKLEGSWRGLHYFVMNTETSTRLKIRLMNASIKDIRDDLTKAIEFDQSALFKKIYEEEYTGNKLSQSKSDEIKKECDVMCEELYKVFDRLTNAHFMPHNISSK